MDSSKKKGKLSEASKNKRRESSESSDSSSDQSGSRRNEKYKNSSSFMEELSSSAFTGASESSTEKRRYQTSSSITEGASSVYSDPSGSRRSEKRRQKKPSSSTQGASSSANTETSGVGSDTKERHKKPRSFTHTQRETPVYAVNTPQASFQTNETFISNSSEVLSAEQSGGTTSTKGSRQSRPRENIQLVPFKVKDVMEMLKDNPAYKDKSPVMIKVKENDIDQILEGKQVIRGKAEPLDKYLQPSPIPLQSGSRNEGESFRMSTGAESGRSRNSRESSQRAEKPFVDEPMFAGADRGQRVFAIPDVQAFPVVHKVPSRRRRRSSRRTPARRRPRVSSTPRRRSRSRRRQSKPVRVPRRSRGRRVPQRPLYRRQYISPCTPFPMCDDDCRVRRPYRRMSRRYIPPRVPSTVYGGPYYRESSPRIVSSRAYNAPYYRQSTPRIVPSRPYNTPYTYSSGGLYYSDNVMGSRPHLRTVSRMNCNTCCNVAQDKLQFIQPGLCSKKKNVWTNEYAVIPKPQVHLIDPCEELDSSIYPRSDNPCIRDGQGNPLTDCIGRPLRSPIGKRFLSFTANGSVMETSIRGNFWTGQPPLCVKCPMPGTSCGQDTTHNWWLSCGYPITPNMDPFYKRVLAAETGPC